MANSAVISSFGLHILILSQTARHHFPANIGSVAKSNSSSIAAHATTDFGGMLQHLRQNSSWSANRIQHLTGHQRKMVHALTCAVPEFQFVPIELDALSSSFSPSPGIWLARGRAVAVDWKVVLNSACHLWRCGAFGKRCFLTEYCDRVGRRRLTCAGL